MQPTSFISTPLFSVAPNVGWGEVESTEAALDEAPWLTLLLSLPQNSLINRQC